MPHTHIYFLTEKARHKLIHAASHKNMNLRRILGHALLLDTLIAELSESELISSEDNSQNEAFFMLESNEHNPRNPGCLNSGPDSESESDSDSCSEPDSDCSSYCDSDCDSEPDSDSEAELDLDSTSIAKQKYISFYSRVKLPVSSLVDILINRGVVILATILPLHLNVKRLSGGNTQ